MNDITSTISTIKGDIHVVGTREVDTSRLGGFVVHVRATHEQNVVGSANFEYTNELRLYLRAAGSPAVFIEPEWRRLKIATCIYRTALHFADTIIPIDDRTEEGDALWRSFGVPRGSLHPDLTKRAAKILRAIRFDTGKTYMDVLDQVAACLRRQRGRHSGPSEVQSVMHEVGVREFEALELIRTIDNDPNYRAVVDARIDGLRYSSAHKKIA